MDKIDRICNNIRANGTQMALFAYFCQTLAFYSKCVGDDLNYFVNGRQPQFFLNEDNFIFFC